MTVLVLGGRGYLGRKICERLTKTGNNVVCTSRQCTDETTAPQIMENNGVQLIPTSPETIEEAMAAIRFDCILNLSCNYGKGDIADADVIDANLNFPLAVLNMAGHYRINYYYSVGTGLNKNLNLYSLTKHTLNEFGKYYADKYSMCYVDMELQMFYGYDEPKDRFIPFVIRKMLRGQDVDITSGTQRRDIVYVEDAVDAITYLLNTKMNGYNHVSIGTGQGPTICEIVNYIHKETGGRSKINIGAIKQRAGESDCIGNPSFLAEKYNWVPVSWKEGLRKMIFEIKETEGTQNQDIF